MSFFANKKKRNIFIICSSIGLVLITLLTIVLIYLNTYYKADKNAINEFTANLNVKTTQIDKNTTVYEGDVINAGLIFYPGGKVECSAYEPLMMQLATDGVMCVLIKMPFNLAVFNSNAANGIQSKFNNIKTWYIGGHSLGGAIAASYLSKHTNEYQGLILLGAYSTANLSNTNLNVISIYGSNDLVLNKDKYNKCLTNYPLNFEQHVIEGGCHSYFGMYGIQKGDGTPTITNAEQIITSSSYISKFMISTI